VAGRARGGVGGSRSLDAEGASGAGFSGSARRGRIGVQNELDVERLGDAAGQRRRLGGRRRRHQAGAQDKPFVMSTATGDPIPPELETLINTAFRVARDRGKPDWPRMTIAVLKNRLLQLSRNSFNERSYGATSMRELLLRFPTLVTLRDGQVELVSAANEAAAESSPSPVRRRVRPDLWRAIVDYSSGQRYTWDAEQGLARPAQEADEIFLPTISQTEMQAWRGEFTALHGSTPALLRWRDDGLGSDALPGALKGEWNGFVKTRVAERLEAWFRDRGEAPPKVLEAPPATAPPVSRVERLRRLVLDCVAVMTEDELTELRLSPDLLLRATSEPGH